MIVFHIDDVMMMSFSVQVVNILGEAQKNETCPPNIREALDHAMVTIHTVEPLIRDPLR